MVRGFYLGHWVRLGSSGRSHSQIPGAKNLPIDHRQPSPLAGARRGGFYRLLAVPSSFAPVVPVPVVSFQPANTQMGKHGGVMRSNAVIG